MSSQHTIPAVLVFLFGSCVLNGQTSPCDLNHDGVVNKADAQLAINAALGLAPCTADLDGSGRCDVIDVQRVINAALGGTCLVAAASMGPLKASSTNAHYFVNGAGQGRRTERVAYVGRFSGYRPERFSGSL